MPNRRPVETLVKITLLCLMLFFSMISCSRDLNTDDTDGQQLSRIDGTTVSADEMER